MPWQQIYDPLNSPWLSTLAALLPAVVLLGCLGLLRLRAHWAALAGLVTALLVGLALYRIPASIALGSSLYGMAYGLLPIGWIILTTILLFRLSESRGLFASLQRSLMFITTDRRLQLILVVFCFGSFLEGAAGFGTPVVVTASILIGLGFPALPAAGLALLANTAPVPFASLGTPVLALQTVTGLDLRLLTSTLALQLSLFDLLLPFWLVTAFSGWKSAWQVAPALLVAGGSYAVTQYAVASLHGPWLVNILSALVSLGALTLFLRVWRPRSPWHFNQDVAAAPGAPALSRGELLRGWAPWLILSLLVFVWGLPQVRDALDSISLVRIPIPGLHLLSQRMPPLTPQPQAESAIFDFAWLSTSGTAILLAALVTAAWLRIRPRDFLAQFGA
ncbi:L-lactate permease, partial [bacterium]